MRAYVEFAKKAFQINITYRADYIAGVINAIVMIFVNSSIWKAIYEDEQTVDGVQFKILITYIVLAFLMQCIYGMEEYFIEAKVRSGSISLDLLKPISFSGYIFSYNVGILVFRVFMQLLPALLVSIILFRLLPPFSLPMLVCFFLSLLLGYLVLYNLNFIIWISSFWFYWSFSLVTIKDAAVMILSGALLPLWFMPQAMVDFINLTPFASIYYVPISIYLGQVPPEEIAIVLVKQLIWAGLLFIMGKLLWKIALKKLVVQGG
jgi:ABC-2 type transport system permease protein